VIRADDAVGLAVLAAELGEDVSFEGGVDDLC